MSKSKTTAAPAATQNPPPETAQQGSAKDTPLSSLRKMRAEKAAEIEALKVEMCNGKELPFSLKWNEMQAQKGDFELQENKIADDIYKAIAAQNSLP